MREKSRLRTFLCDELNDTPDGDDGLKGTVLALSDVEAAHVRTMRIRKGQVIALADGLGHRWASKVVALGRGGVRCRLERALPSRPLLPIDLWAPVGHRDRSLWLVEKAVEIGVRSIRWVSWRRSSSVGDAGSSKAFQAKALRRAIAALKQSDGSWLPALHPPEEAADALSRPIETGWLADRGGLPPYLTRWGTMALGGVTQGAALIVVVGPEGGLTLDEVDRCKDANLELVSLAPGVLRFETAALAAIAVGASMLRPVEPEQRPLEPKEQISGPDNLEKL